MRVVLEPSLFSDESVDPASLLQLILACRRPSAHFAVGATPRRPEVEAWLAQWPARVGRTLREVLSDAVENARRPRALTIVVRPGESRWRERPNKGPRVSVADALALARAPLTILVENRRNDGRFLSRLAITLPEAQRTLFEDAVTRGWIVFEQGGGLPEVQHLLDDLDARADDPVLCPCGTRFEVRRWRMAVVVDRDSFEIKRPRSILKANWTAPPRDPTRPSAVSSEVVRRASIVLPDWEGRDAAHQLCRRAIENYLPLRTLRAWVDNATTVVGRDERRRSVEALKVLDTPDALGVRPRWRFGMKDGLDGDKPNGLKGPATSNAHVHRVFHVLSESERVALQRGFTTRSESIADLLFDRMMARDEWLREELGLDGSTEAQDLLLNLLNRM